MSERTGPQVLATEIITAWVGNEDTTVNTINADNATDVAAAYTIVYQAITASYTS